MSRTTPARMSERVSSADRAALDALIAEVPVGHFGFVADDLPVVMPIAIAADGGGILLHGSTGSWWLRRLATGIPVSLAVTALDGVVVARSAFESSMHYRSAVLFGSCTPVDGAEKLRALDLITEALIPGRVAEVRAPTSKELAATLVLRMIVDEWSIKVSDGWPEDAASDIEGDAWAGVIPSAVRRGPALAAPDLRAGIPVARSVARLVEG